MQRIVKSTLAGIACVAVGSEAAFVRTEPTHLRAATDSDQPWKAAIEASISNFNLPAPVSVAAAKTTAVGEGDKGDKGAKKSKTDQPVSVQVADGDLKKFMDGLSTGCSQRFKQTLNGKGGDLHTFGAAGAKADSASCTKLQGTLCATQAHIIHEKTVGANGRKMESTTDASGKSCLPSECMSQTDLDRLSTFMHTQAKSIIPGDEHRVELHVDCTANGGTTAAVGVKSGSASLVPTVLTAVLALGVFARA